MFLSDVVLLACLAIVLYPYLIYPFFLAVAARLRPRPVCRRPLTGTPPAVSILVAAYNEEARIGVRLRELIRLLEARGNDADEIVVVTDGSTDATAATVLDVGHRSVRLLEQPQRKGKAAALSRGAAEARNEFLVFADVRQRWAGDALERLLENFADPSVGAVSGELVVTTAEGAMAGVGLYWHFEKWLRKQESAIGSQVGVTGAISACRRKLFQPIPAGVVLDDVYWPVGVALQGKRVIHDSRAVAYDRLPDRVGDEFRRKVRTLAGNFQLVAMRPEVLLPWRNPIWVQLISHKLARLVVPWALLVLLVASFIGEGPWHTLAFAAQTIVYLLAAAALINGRSGKVGSAAASVVVLNVAAWVAFWVWLSGKASQSWTKVNYRPAAKLSKEPRLQAASTATHASVSDLELYSGGRRG